MAKKNYVHSYRVIFEQAHDPDADILDIRRVDLIVYAKNIEEVTPEEETVIETKFNTAIQGSYIQTITDIVNAIMTSYYSYPQYDYNTTSLNDLDYYGV